MNIFEIKKQKVSDRAGKVFYEKNAFYIDGKPLSDYLDAWTKDNPSLQQKISPTDDLEICWTDAYDYEGDARFMRYVLSKDHAITPILSCPDDFDFSCIVIVADIVKQGDFVFWKRIGMVDHSRESFEEEIRSGILCVEAYSDEDWTRYGDNIALEKVKSPEWYQWINENWTEELFRRRVNYTFPYYQDDKNIIWIADCDFTFERIDYEKMVPDCVL